MVFKGAHHSTSPQAFVNKVGLTLRASPDSRDGVLIFDGVYYAKEKGRPITRELAILVPDAITGNRDRLGEASLP